MGWGWSDEWSQQLGWSSSDHPVVVWLVTVVGFWFFVAVGLYGSWGSCFIGFFVALVLGLVVGSIAGSLDEFLVGSCCLLGRSVAATVGGLVPGGSALVGYWVGCVGMTIGC